MTQTAATQSNLRVMATTCLTALWLLIVIKALWLLLGVSDLHLVSPMPIFCVAFISLLGATLTFQMEQLLFGLALSWAGVILGYVAGHVSGVVPGIMTDRMHEQFLSHWADISFLAVAHLLFILRRFPVAQPAGDAR